MRASRCAIAFLMLSAATVGGCKKNTPRSSMPSTNQTSSAWHNYDFQFQVANASGNGHSLWLCGSNEALAVSRDDGNHWEVRRLQKASERSLMSVGFANPKFGYATGTGGVFLTTADGGESWVDRTTFQETIVQASFADDEHGLVKTAKSIMFTTDGGSHWSKVSDGQNQEDMRHFPHVFSLVALDSAHMAVMLKEGPAQYSAQALVFTKDSGKTWGFLNIPNVTLYSFLRVDGQYWAVGTEVIHKDEPGGGYAVPVALYSTDGETWEHTDAELSACRLEMCTLCRSQGCLASNGVIAQIFSKEAALYAFPPNQGLTTKWASTDSAVCFVRAHVVECASLQKAQARSASPSPFPVPAAVEP
jgi:Photosynthesis system II assembly factor YCF48